MRAQGCWAGLTLEDGSFWGQRSPAWPPRAGSPWLPGRAVSPRPPASLHQPCVSSILESTGTQVNTGAASLNREPLALVPSGRGGDCRPTRGDQRKSGGVLTAHRCLPVWAAGPVIAERALAGGRCDPKVSLRVCVHSLLTRLGQPQAGVTGVCRHEGQGGSCPLHGPCLAGPEFADCSSPVRAAGRAGSAEPRILQRKS